MAAILALADDMTGALEVGAKFSAAGIRTVVSAKPIPAPQVQALVFDTETRHLSPECAAIQVKRFVTDSGVICPSLIYKKTDSTLRGNISSELRALLQLYPHWRIGYAPAYPALGRTVKMGVLYIDGIAAAETVFSKDALNPVNVSSLSSLLGAELACTIFDGEIDVHLEEAARTILSDESMRIAAGPGALAGMIAEQIDLPRGVPRPLPAVRSCLVMNGSRHERSVQQMRHADMLNWRRLTPSSSPGSDPARVAEANGQYAVEQVAAEEPDALFVIGGDTAFAVVAALGMPPLWPVGEAVPGVPVACLKRSDLGHSLPFRKRDLFFITKAGGFGAPDVIRRVHQVLNTNGR